MLDRGRVRVYRYASRTEALSLMSKGTFRFRRPGAWKEPYERHVASKLFGDAGPFAHVHAFAKCFSLEYRSEPMWRLFNSEDGVVRMTFDLEKLIRGLEAGEHVDGTRPKLYIGRVHYMPQAVIRQAVEHPDFCEAKKVSRHAMRSLLMKRDGFAFENEVRACFIYDQAAISEETRDVSRIPVALIERVLIDPYALKEEVSEWRRACMAVAGLKCPVTQSEFDKDPAEFV